MLKPTFPLQMIGDISEIDNFRESITVSDASLPDLPLVYVNRGFEKFSGYSRSEVLGKNCRFFQGTNRQQRNIVILRNAIARNSSCIVDLVNYRKNGDEFVNRLSITPVFNSVGDLIYYVGLQSDISGMFELQALVVEKIRSAWDHEYFFI